MGILAAGYRYRKEFSKEQASEGRGSHVLRAARARSALEHHMAGLRRRSRCVRKRHSQLQPEGGVRLSGRKTVSNVTALKRA
jgi:hypothetical protein